MDGVKVIKAKEDTWVIEDKGVRFFLLKGDEKAALIDSGMTTSDIKPLLEEFSSFETILVNTHADMDHVSRNGQFEAFYMHPGEYCNYFSKHDSGNPIALYEGDVIELGNRSLEVIHLPGHTPGSIGLLDRRDRVLIAGDPIQRNGKIFMFGPYRDMRAYIASLTRLQERFGEFDDIWASHADLSVSKEVVEELIHGAERILRGEINAKDFEFHGKHIKEYDGGPSSFLLD